MSHPILATSELADLGAYGALLVMILREVFAFLRGQKKSNGSGDKAPEFWIENIRKLFREELEIRFKQRDEEIRRVTRETVRDVLREVLDERDRWHPRT